MAKPLHVLFIEDNPDDTELLLIALKKEGYDPIYRRVDTDHDLRLALLSEEWDIVLCDWAIPGFDAPAALEVVQSSARDVPFVIVSGTVGEETAVAAMRSGAHDFLVKGKLRRLSPVIERELAERQLRRERNKVETDLRNREVMLATIGEVAERLVRVDEMDKVFRDVLQAIGTATSSDRAFLYRHRLPKPEGPVLSSLACEWVGSKALPRLGAPSLQDMVWSEMGLADGVAALERGETVRLLAKDFTGQLQEINHESGMRSFILVPIRIDGAWWGTVGLGDLSEERTWTEGESSGLRTLASTIGAAVERANLMERVRRAHAALLESYDRTLDGWARALELRDKETEGHSRRVTEVTMRIARHLGIEGDELANVRRGALLHDIGKMGIPDAILFKPGALTDEEWQVMQLHPLLAYDLLSSIPFLVGAIQIPYCHHERWDGTGYPRGLRGEEIPLGARIFAVADVWDAMRSDRPYHLAHPAEKALEYIVSQAGKAFDPDVVQAFLEVIGVAGTATIERVPVSASS